MHVSKYDLKGPDRYRSTRAAMRSAGGKRWNEQRKKDNRGAIAAGVVMAGEGSLNDYSRGHNDYRNGAQVPLNAPKARIEGWKNALRQDRKVETQLKHSKASERMNVAIARNPVLAAEVAKADGTLAA